VVSAEGEEEGVVMGDDSLDAKWNSMLAKISSDATKRRRAVEQSIIDTGAWVRGREQSVEAFLAAFAASGGCSTVSCHDRGQEPGEGDCRVCVTFRAARDFKVGDE